MDKKMKISVIGAGAMGGALVEGMLRSGLFAAGDIVVSDPNAAAVARYAELGAAAAATNAAAVAGADIVLVVVKPWLVEAVLRGIAGAIAGERQRVVVVAAGISGGNVSVWLANESGNAPSAYLAIPNIAAAQGQSMTFISTINDDDATAVTALFDIVGRTAVVPESLLPAATTLASCGIAYALRYVRAATEGGVELGFRAKEAQDIVAQTVAGAISLLLASGEHPEALIDRVTTPGGVTIKGLNEMEKAGFTAAVVRGLKAGAR